RTTSQAVNGPIAPSPYSVIVLDPYNASFPNGRKGCPSALISGGPTITLEGSMIIDSACTTANGGGLATNGNSATLTMNNGAVIKIVGGYAPAALTISPTPTTGAAYVKDPLSGLTSMSGYIGAVPGTATIPLRFSSKQTFGGSDVVLEPGIYVGGI